MKVTIGGGRTEIFGVALLYTSKSDPTRFTLWSQVVYTAKNVGEAKAIARHRTEEQWAANDKLAPISGFELTSVAVDGCYIE
jgi:hypothetical protein